MKVTPIVPTSKYMEESWRDFDKRRMKNMNPDDAQKAAMQFADIIVNSQEKKS